MPPKRTMEDVDEEGDEEESIQQIKIVRREDSMCEICSRILKSAGALARHKREVHECEEFVCQECGLVLETATKLKSHRRNHKTFLCDKCEKSVSLSNKQRHMKICKGKGNEAVTILHCDECDYQTSKKYNMKRHKEKHSRINCDECGKSFTSLQKLDEHKSLVHPVLYYHCEHCEFKSTKKWIRNRHQELNCRVKKSKLIPALSKEEALLLFSDCNITKKAFNRILGHLRRKYGSHVAKNCTVSFYFCSFIYFQIGK